MAADPGHERNGKKVYALETVEEQLSLFDDMPEPDQVAMLASLLNDVDMARGMFRELIENYLARDLTAIHQQMVEQASLEDQSGWRKTFQKNFITARNKRMVERMARHSRRRRELRCGRRPASARR